MSENIAGYIDRSYIKGQYYKYAASPKPVVFSGNIDDISDDELLVKTMFVTRGQVSGTLPNDFGNNFLITTVKYGDSAYLQTAYLIQTNYECYEYRRIYFGSWTDWIGVDSQIKAVDDKIQSVKDSSDRNSQNIATISSQISSINSNIQTITDSTLPGMSGTVTNLDNRVRAVENKTTITDISNQYEITKTGGGWTINSIGASKFGNVVNMNIQFKGSGSSVSAGSNAFTGTISKGTLPVTTGYLFSYTTTALAVCQVGYEGNVVVRILSSSLNLAKTSTIRLTGMFFIN